MLCMLDSVMSGANRAGFAAPIGSGAGNRDGAPRPSPRARGEAGRSWSAGIGRGDVGREESNRSRTSAEIPAAGRGLLRGLRLREQRALRRRAGQGLAGDEETLQLGDAEGL